MNYLQEFDELVGRFEKNEEIFRVLVERGIRMFYNGSKIKFLMDLLSESDGLSRPTIKDIDTWICSHNNKPSLQMQKIVVDVFATKSDSYLRDKRLMIAAQIRFASKALFALIDDESNKNILSRLSRKDDKDAFFSHLFRLSSDLYTVSCNLECTEKENK